MKPDPGPLEVRVAEKFKELFDYQQEVALCEQTMSDFMGWVKLQAAAEKDPEGFYTEDFLECETCNAKPGSPPLCRPCLNNRRLIEKYKVVASKLKEALEYDNIPTR